MGELGGRDAGVGRCAHVGRALTARWESGATQREDETERVSVGMKRAVAPVKIKARGLCAD